MRTPICQIGIVSYAHIEAAAEEYFANAGNVTGLPVIYIRGHSVNCAANTQLELERNSNTRTLHKVSATLDNLRRRDVDISLYDGVCRRLANEVASYAAEHLIDDSTCICVIVSGMVFQNEGELATFMSEAGQLIADMGLSTPSPESPPINPFYTAYDRESNVAVLYLATGYPIPRLWNKYTPRSA